MGAIVLWGNLPNRVQKVEAGQAAQEEDLNDLKGWAREIQGYTKAQQELQQQIYQRQDTANAPQRPTWRFQEQDDDGTTWCCDERTTEACWEQTRWVPC